MSRINKKNTNYLLFGLLMVLILSACKTKESKIFDDIYSKQLVYPQNLKNCNNNTDSLRDFFNSDVKIIITENLGCSKCCGHLIMMKEFVDSLNLQNKISIIVYGYAHYTEISIFDFLLYDEDFQYPIYADSLKQFISKNKLPEENMAFHTFLVDKNDSIRVIGSPVLNEKIKDLYIKEIKKTLQEHI